MTNNNPVWSFNSSTDNDSFDTSLQSWADLRVDIRPTHVVWDPFYNKGAAKKHIEKTFGCKCIHEPNDFWDERTHPDPSTYDFIVTNPPFSQMKEVVAAILAKKKPFAILMRLTHTGTKYMSALMNGVSHAFIHPQETITFEVNNRRLPIPGWHCVWVTNIPYEKPMGRWRVYVSV